MHYLSSIWKKFLELITPWGYWRVAPRYFLNVSPVALKATRYWERRRVRNFDGRKERRPLCRRFPVIAVLGLLVLPLGTASADILYVTDFSNERISVIDTTKNIGEEVLPIDLNMGFDGSGAPLIPWCIAVTPDGTKAYVTTDPIDLLDGGNVYIIDTASHTVSGVPFRIPPQAPEGGGGGHPCVVISPDGTRAYLSNGSFDSTGDSKIVRILTNQIPTNQNPPVDE